MRFHGDFGWGFWVGSVARAPRYVTEFCLGADGDPHRAYQLTLGESVPARGLFYIQYVYHKYMTHKVYSTTHVRAPLLKHKQIKCSTEKHTCAQSPVLLHQLV